MKHAQAILVTVFAGLVSAGHQGSQYNNAAGPSTSYGVPSSGYGVPSSGYGAPSSGYGAPSSGYGAPSSGYVSAGGYDNTGSHGNNGGYGSGGNAHGGVNNYDEQPKSYQFGYAVRDYASGNDYGRQEASDGNVVQGEYRVQLPDGRLQIVTYVADWRNGFRADVRYEGEAQFPAGNGAGGAGGDQAAGRPVYGPPGYHQ